MMCYIMFIVLATAVKITLVQNVSAYVCGRVKYRLRILDPLLFVDFSNVGALPIEEPWFISKCIWINATWERSIHSLRRFIIDIFLTLEDRFWLWNWNIGLKYVGGFSRLTEVRICPVVTWLYYQRLNVQDKWIYFEGGQSAKVNRWLITMKDNSLNKLLYKCLTWGLFKYLLWALLEDIIWD